MGGLSRAINRIPHSAQLRRVIGAFYLLQGVGYFLTYIPGSALTTSYQLQAAIMPVWVWGGSSFVLGSVLLLTVRMRYWLFGRIVAGVIACVAAWQLGTYMEASAYTVLASYIIVLTILVGEAVFVGGERA